MVAMFACVELNGIELCDSVTISHNSSMVSLLLLFFCYYLLLLSYLSTVMRLSGGFSNNAFPHDPTFRQDSPLHIVTPDLPSPKTRVLPKSVQDQGSV